MPGIMEGEKWFECVTCVNEWKVAYHFCQNCIATVQPQHPPRHVFHSFACREVPYGDEKHVHVECLECSQSMNVSSATEHDADADLPDNIQDPQALVGHHHPEYEIRVGPLEKQDRAHRQYRDCPRHGVKDIDTKEEDMYDGEMGCQCCWKKFLKDPKACICRQCEFTAGPCCYETGIANHPHPMIEVWYKQTTPPDDFWKTWLGGSVMDVKVCAASLVSFLHHVPETDQELHENTAVIKADIEAHLRCSRCDDYDLCMNCVFKKDVPNVHGSCPDNVPW